MVSYPVEKVSNLSAMDICNGKGGSVRGIDTVSNGAHPFLVAWLYAFSMGMKKISKIYVMRSNVRNFGDDDDVEHLVMGRFSSTDEELGFDDEDEEQSRIPIARSSDVS